MFRSKFFLIWLFVIIVSKTFGQSDFKVLHFTKTSGFDHGTRENSFIMFQEMGVQHGFTVDDDQTGTAFDSLSVLQQYAVVIFSNTSGDAILNATQRANFETYIANGGSIIGIHAASDTYRHSTANGPNTGEWDWYAELLGGSVQTNPNHTSSNYPGIMDKLVDHPLTEDIPDPWEKMEEYYYWENGFLDPSNIDLLQVRSTGMNSYDAPRPMSWYKMLPNGGRSFYTALGHANSNFTSDTAFQNHLRNALLWAANITSFDEVDTAIGYINIYPNPAGPYLTVKVENHTSHLSYHFLIFDLFGRNLLELKEMTNFYNEIQIPLGNIPDGMYFLKVHHEKNNIESIQRFCKKSAY